MVYDAVKAGKPKGLNEIFLQKITAALEKNYHDENYGIFKLCLDIGISRAQLHRKLIALTGKSTSDLMRHYRMKKAKDFLLTSDKSISEIAYQVGFKDPNYFTKSFIRENGINPSNFRLENHPVKQ
jgi:AraC-like DNA-binding protein